MKRLLLLLPVCLFALSACVPMAMFASGTSGYQHNLGVQVANGNVNTVCLGPRLRLAIWDIEGHFHKKVVMTSGYRSPWHNASVGGAESSYHMKCMAADIFIPGVRKSELIAYAKQMGSVGGLGCYYGQSFIHIDVRGRPRSGPITWGC